MRFLGYIAAILVFVPVMAQAQTAPVYYNAPSSSKYSTNAPLNLKAMLRGAGEKSGRSGSSYNNKATKSYGVDRSSYSLALSPQEVAAHQQKRAREQAAREREQAQQKTSTQSETNQYLSQLQGDDPLGNNPQTQPGRVIVHDRNKNNFTTPKRVFNTPY